MAAYPTKAPPIEFDAIDVFKSYAATLASTSGMVRSVAELAYPKDVVRAVLLHMLKIAKNADREVLEGAYVGLADFQVLTDREAWAVRSWAQLQGMGDPNRLTDEQLREAAFVVAEIGPLLKSVNSRVANEAKALAGDLEVLRH